MSKIVCYVHGSLVYFLPKLKKFSYKYSDLIIMKDIKFYMISKNNNEEHKIDQPLSNNKL